MGNTTPKLPPNSTGAALVYLKNGQLTGLAKEKKCIEFINQHYPHDCTHNKHCTHPHKYDDKRYKIIAMKGIDDYFIMGCGPEEYTPLYIQEITQGRTKYDPQSGVLLRTDQVEFFFVDIKECKWTTCRSVPIHGALTDLWDDGGPFMEWNDERFKEAYDATLADLRVKDLSLKKTKSFSCLSHSDDYQDVVYDRLIFEEAPTSLVDGWFWNIQTRKEIKNHCLERHVIQFDTRLFTITQYRTLRHINLSPPLTYPKKEACLSFLNTLPTDWDLPTEYLKLDSDKMIFLTARDVDTKFIVGTRGMSKRGTSCQLDFFLMDPTQGDPVLRKQKFTFTCAQDVAARLWLAAMNNDDDLVCEHPDQWYISHHTCLGATDWGSVSVTHGFTFDLTHRSLLVHPEISVCES